MVARVHNLTCTGRFLDIAATSNLGFWRQTVASGPNGSSTFTLIAVLMANARLAKIYSGGSIIADFPGATGYRLFWDPPPSGFRFQVFDGGGVSRIVDRVLTVADLDQNKARVVTCVYNGGVEMVTRCSGVGETTGGPFAGFSASNGTKSVGVNTGSTVGAVWHVAAILADDTVALNAAQRAAAELAVIDDLQQGRSIRSSILSANQIYWDARDCDYTLNTWPVRRGVANALGKNSRPEAYGFAARF